MFDPTAIGLGNLLVHGIFLCVWNLLTKFTKYFIYKTTGAGLFIITLSPYHQQTDTTAITPSCGELNLLCETERLFTSDSIEQNTRECVYIISGVMYPVDPHNCANRSSTS